MRRSPSSDAAFSQGSAISCEQVDLVHVHTFESHAAINPPPIPNDEILKAERHTPDGSPPSTGEFRVIRPFVIGLGLAGLLLVVVTMAYSTGWEAAAVGGAWVLLGYLIAWIVVWGAGLIREAEEREIEEPKGRRSA